VWVYSNPFDPTLAHFSLANMLIMLIKSGAMSFELALVVAGISYFQ
jgi:hypothetical protein